MNKTIHAGVRLIVLAIFLCSVLVMAPCFATDSEPVGPVSIAGADEKNPESRVLAEKGLFTTETDGVWIPSFCTDVVQEKNGSYFFSFDDIWGKYQTDSVDNLTAWAFNSLYGDNANAADEGSLLFSFSPEVLNLHGREYLVDSYQQKGDVYSFSCTDEFYGEKCKLDVVLDGEYAEIYLEGEQEPSDTIVFVNENYTRYLCYLLYNYACNDYESGYYPDGKWDLFTDTSWIESWEKKTHVIDQPRRADGSGDYDIPCRITDSDERAWVLQMQTGGVMSLLLENGDRTTRSAEEVVFNQGDFEFFLKDEKAIVSKFYGDDHVVIPAALTIRQKSFPITEIGNDVFSRMDIQSVSIPAGVTVLGENLFCDCENLEEVSAAGTISSIGESAFDGCESLTRCALNCNHAQIAEYAFSGCSSLTAFPLSGTIDEIGAKAFKNCSALKAVVLSASLTSIDAEAFAYCENLVSITLPDSVTKLGEETFAGCWSLKKIILPDALTVVPPSAFSECTSLRSVRFGKAVVTIGAHAFDRCESLDSLVLPDSVRELQNCAFEDCTSLTSISLGGNIRTLGSYCFSGCTTLQKATLAYGIEEISENMFDNCTALKTVELPSTILRIDDSAFSGCSSLDSITLPDSVQTWGKYIFYECDSFTSVPVSKNMKTIPYGYMGCCEGLKKITLPDSIKTIEDQAFDTCEQLEEVVIGTHISKIGDGVFIHCSRLEKIKVAKGSRYYEFRDDALFEKKTKTLVWYLPEKKERSYHIPEGTKAVLPMAFTFSNLTELFVPASVRISDMNTRYFLLMPGFSGVSDTGSTPAIFLLLHVVSGSDAARYAKRNDLTYTTAAEFPFEMGGTYRLADNLKLRKGPSLTSESILTLQKGIEVTVYSIGPETIIDGITSNWVSIVAKKGSKDKDGNTLDKSVSGWCFGGYLE